jgi:hypothetical protein
MSDPAGRPAAGQRAAVRRAPTAMCWSATDEVPARSGRLGPQHRPRNSAPPSGSAPGQAGRRCQAQARHPRPSRRPPGRPRPHPAAGPSWQVARPRRRAVRPVLWLVVRVGWVSLARQPGRGLPRRARLGRWVSLARQPGRGLPRRARLGRSARRLGAELSRRALRTVPPAPWASLAPRPGRRVVPRMVEVGWAAATAPAAPPAATECRSRRRHRPDYEVVDAGFPPSVCSLSSPAATQREEHPNAMRPNLAPSRADV